MRKERICPLRLFWGWEGLDKEPREMRGGAIRC